MAGEHEHHDYFGFGGGDPPPETPDVERPEGEGLHGLLIPVPRATSPGIVTGNLPDTGASPNSACTAASCITG